MRRTPRAIEVKDHMANASTGGAGGPAGNYTNTTQGAKKPGGGHGLAVVACIVVTVAVSMWLHSNDHGFLMLLWIAFMVFVTLGVIGIGSGSTTSSSRTACKTGPVHVVDTGLHDVPAVSNDFFRKQEQYWKVSLDGHVDGVVGNPGVGLDSSDFGSDRVAAGQEGEKNLAKMMVQAGVVGNGLNSYWSLRIPDSSYDTDVDAIVTFGNRMILIDAKEYVSGDGYTYEPVYGVDRVDVWQEPTTKNPARARHLVKRYDFSRNMEMALEKYRKAFPTMDVEAVVLLCPTRRGLAAVKAGCSICNGAIPVTQSWAWLQDLRKKLDESETRPTTDPAVDHRLRALLKH